MNLKIRTKGLFLLFSLAMVIFLFSFSSRADDKSLDPGGLKPIMIHDGSCESGEPLELSIQDIIKYRGKLSTCSLFAYRALKLAFSELWEDQIPNRVDISINNFHTCGGSRDAFEFITRVVTRGQDNYNVALPRENDMSIDNFRFIFTRRSTNEKIDIKVKESFFPEGFFQLRKTAKSDQASPQEKEIFEEAQRNITEKLIKLELNEIFHF